MPSRTPLAPGTRLGSYEILGVLGAGGMGEVYRARDTRLDRFVAIKVLPKVLADSPEAAARFEREAKAVAALSHPNILAIFDFGQAGETAYAVMELLDGETLREKLVSPIPVRKSIDYGAQIARGLAAAHSRGIMHRDLKPENVFVTADGRVKILDFGLARQAPAFAQAADVTASPTIERHTEPGTVLGTVGYMSPEQARGDAGDYRSDIFSLGALLYELVSGRRAFQRDTAAETLTAILREDPPELSSSTSAAVPPGVVRVIDHCLEKNPAERFQSASDVAFALENLSGASTSAVHAAVASVSKRRRWLPWGVAAAFALLSIGLSVQSLRAPNVDRPVSRLSIELPKQIPYDCCGGPYRGLAISPDGRRLVYVARPGPGRQQIYTRSLDRLAVEPLAGTDGAYQPFFSPDGKWLAFFTISGELKKLSLDGGPAVTLVRGLLNGQWGFGVWRPDDVIVFSAFENLLQIPASGGTPTALTTVNTAAHESYHQFPQLVPSTGDILFTVTDDDERSRLEILRSNTHARSVVLDNATATVLTTSGRLVFNRDGVLMGAAFDPQRRTAGPAVPLTESPIVDTPRFDIPQLAVSAAGTLAYVPTRADEPAPTVGWVTRAGAFEELGMLPNDLGSAALSPDGKTLAVNAGNRVLLFDLLRHITTPIDVGRRRTESIGWHPDGKRLTLGGPYLSLFDLDTGKETRLTVTGRPKRFASWSPDGRTVAYMTFNPNNDIQVLSLDGGGKPRPLVATDAIESTPAISPDGRWMAYTSTATGDPNGRRDVYVVRFPEGTGRVQITSAGGGVPFWSRDGRELFFPAPPGVLQSVSVAAGDRLQVGAPRTLFMLGDLQVVAASPDGSRFLAVRIPRVAPRTEIVVVQNWLQELSRLVPSSVRSASSF